MTVYDDDAFDSPQEALAHYKEPLKALRARKRALDIQAAKYGIAVPAHVVTELEGVSTQIRQLGEQVRKLEGRDQSLPITTEPPVSEPSTKVPIEAPIEQPTEDGGEQGSSLTATQWQVLVEIGRRSTFTDVFEAFFGGVPSNTQAKDKNEPRLLVNDSTLANDMNMRIQMVHECMDALQTIGCIVITERSQGILGWLRTQPSRKACDATLTDKGREWLDSRKP